MWGFTTQAIDGMAGSAGGATVGSAGGIAVNDRDDLAALGLLPTARDAGDGPLFSREVRPAAGPGIADRHSGAGRSPMM